MRRALVPKSKLLSLVLRHDPSSIGVQLDAGGWIDVDVLAAALAAHEPDFSRADLDEIVVSNAKQRFILSDDGRRIRAAQGHSLGVELGLPPTPPPTTLFHGTAERHVASIRERGLEAGQRDFVHLSSDEATAHETGARHGRPIVLVIEARRMAEAGFDFYQAENGVWLTREVPVTYVRLPD